MNAKLMSWAVVVAQVGLILGSVPATALAGGRGHATGWSAPHPSPANQATPGFHGPSVQQMHAMQQMQAVQQMQAAHFAAAQQARLQSLQARMQAKAAALNNELQQKSAQMTPKQRRILVRRLQAEWWDAMNSWEAEYWDAMNPLSDYDNSDWAMSFGGNYSP